MPRNTMEYSAAPQEDHQTGRELREAVAEKVLQELQEKTQDLTCLMVPSIREYWRDLHSETLIGTFRDQTLNWDQDARKETALELANRATQEDHASIQNVLDHPGVVEGNHRGRAPRIDIETRYAMNSLMAQDAMETLEKNREQLGQALAEGNLGALDYAVRKLGKTHEDNQDQIWSRATGYVHLENPDNEDEYLRLRDQRLNSMESKLTEFLKGIDPSLTEGEGTLAEKVNSSERLKELCAAFVTNNDPDDMTQ